MYSPETGQIPKSRNWIQIHGTVYCGRGWVHSRSCSPSSRPGKDLRTALHQLAMRTTVCFCLASTLTDTLTLKCLCLTDKNKGFDPPPSSDAHFAFEKRQVRELNRQAKDWESVGFLTCLFGCLTGVWHMCSECRWVLAPSLEESAEYWWMWCKATWLWNGLSISCLSVCSIDICVY